MVRLSRRARCVITTSGRLSQRVLAIPFTDEGGIGPGSSVA
jgi:hypothetical protein